MQAKRKGQEFYARWTSANCHNCLSLMQKEREGASEVKPDERRFKEFGEIGQSLGVGIFSLLKIGRERNF